MGVGSTVLRRPAKNKDMAREKRILLDDQRRTRPWWQLSLMISKEMEAAWLKRREIGLMERAEREHRIMAPSDPSVKREEVEGSTATMLIWFSR
jgi:hypothetical protein